MGYNIMIVDDSSVMRKIIRRNIRQTGLPVDREYEAGDGDEALQMLSGCKVDFIFSDVNMPNMDGVTFVKEVRKNPQWNEVKILMITTEAGLDMVQDSLSAGANSYVVKPFTPEQLLAKIQDVLEMQI